MAKVTIDVEARFVDHLSDEARASTLRAQRELNKLDKTKVKPLIDIENNKFLRKLRELEAKMRKLGHTKTAVVLHAVDKASTVIAKVINKAHSIAGQVWNAYVKVRDSEAVSSLKKVGSLGKSIAGKTWRAVVKVADYATAPLRKLKNMLFSIQTLIGSIVAGMAAKKFIVDPIGLADQYSGSYIGFSTLLGKTRGQQMMNEIDRFAKKTPFKTSGVINNVQKMMSYGWDPERIIEDMETIGDAAAATGKGDQGLESIVYALSEIRSKGKLSTQELNQLASAGIRAKGYLAEGLGYGTSDEGMMKLAKDLEKGTIGANQAIDLILKGMKEFQGMMDRTATETVSGLWSNIEDTFEINIFRRWGQGLQDGARKSFGAVVDLLDNAEAALVRFGDTLYEVGKTISNWAADKFQKLVDRILKITGSFEFKKASLGEKISMLWNGAIVDPLKEWWDKGGRAKTAETAGKIGKWMGEFITDGLLALFGATDILDKSVGEKSGKSVGGSFLKGFLDGFDASAITKAFVDAISNVWGALPWWGKILVGGYAGAKVLGGIGSLAGGISSGIGAIGSVLGTAGVAGIGSKGLLGFLANTGYRVMDGPLFNGTTALSVGGGTAALAGAGALTAGAGIIHTGLSAYDAYKSYKQGDIYGGRANLARAGFTAAGIGGGALAGAKLGAMTGSFAGPVGTLVGAGIGTAVGWFAGDKIAKHIEAAKFEVKALGKEYKNANTEAEKAAIKAKAIYLNLKKHFGDIKLSMDEIKEVSKQIVWGEKLDDFDKFTASTQNAEANLQSLKNATTETNKWMWKAGLGVKFNEGEKKSFKKAFDDYINGAKSYVENKHYEFTAAVSLLVNTKSGTGKEILESGNAYYGKLKAELDKAGKTLGDTLSKALEDGIISADEQKAIAAAQKKIADITNKIATANQEAKLELIKVKFDKGNIDLDSFQNLMTSLQSTLEERLTNTDKAFTASVASLKLQLKDGAISQKEYDKQLKALIEGRTTSIKEAKIAVKKVAIEILGNAYQNELGENAAEKLNKALNQAITDKIDPIEWSDEKLKKLLGVDNISDESLGAIKQQLSEIFNNFELVEVDGKIKLNPKVENKGEAKEKVKEEVDKDVPDKVDKNVDVHISGNKVIQNTIEVWAEEFGIPESQAKLIALLLTGDKKVLNKIDVSTLAKEFGIPESQAKTILEKLTGEKSIENRLSIMVSEFGIPDTLSKTIKVNLKAIKGKITNAIGSLPVAPRWQSMGYDGGDARGGIEYPHGFNAPGFAGGGMVRGGAKLIKVAEEGTPEMIIPLGSQRRERALKLWEKAGEMLGVNGFARGGRTDGGDEGIRFKRYSSDEPTGGQTVQVDVGGVTVNMQIDANGSNNIVEAIKAQSNEIAETMAGIFADAFKGQFENTPVRGGA